MEDNLQNDSSGQVIHLYAQDIGFKIINHQKPIFTFYQIRYPGSGDGFEGNNYPIGPGGTSNIPTGIEDRNRPGQAYPPGR